METITDKEKYLMEEIDLYIRLLQKVHLNGAEAKFSHGHKSKADLAKWYEGYLQERS